MPRVTAVRPLGGHVLHLRFDDGSEGTIDFADHWDFTGVFAPLRDEALFARVAVIPDFGTIGWPNEVDVDPDVLYSRATGAPLPDWASPDDPTTAAA